MRHRRGWAAGIVLAIGVWAPGVSGADLFDQVPDLKRRLGVEKLTPQERANLERLLLSLSARATSSDGDCSSGIKAAVEEAAENACDSALSRCRRSCPSSVYDYEMGNYLYNTDAGSKCEEACRAGRRACEP